MPVYLFTLHSLGSWMPDHAKGYTKRNKGIFPTDTHMAGHYRNTMTNDQARFDQTAQRIIIAAVQEKAELKAWTLYAVATDPTHAHILIAWDRFTPWLDIRRALKASITRQLNTKIAHRKWLSEAGSRKRITSETHFHHLLKTYLPNHRGKTWIHPKYKQ